MLPSVFLLMIFVKMSDMSYGEKIVRHMPRCLHCGEQIRYGRIDKKYCCDECRNRHHNVMARFSRTYKRKVLSQLSCNYELLDELVNAGVDSISLSDIASMGFITSVMTSYQKVGKHNEFRCFDIKYIMSATRIFSITKIKMFP